MLQNSMLFKYKVILNKKLLNLNRPSWYIRYIVKKIIKDFIKFFIKKIM